MAIQGLHSVQSLHIHFPETHGNTLEDAAVCNNVPGVVKAHKLTYALNVDDTRSENTSMWVLYTTLGASFIS